MKTKVAPRSKARASTLKKVGKKITSSTRRQAAKPAARKASAALAASKPATKPKAPAHLNGTASTNAKGTDLPIVYVNGRMVPKSQATVSVYDHGLLYGDGIFEGIRIYKGKIFKCKQHMERLYHCAEQIRLTIPVPMEEMVRIQRRCIEVNRLEEGYIRLVVTRGFGTLGLDPRRCPTAGVICIADQIRLFPVEQYETGMRVVVANRPKTPIACLDPRVKTLNYLNNILAKMEAIDFGCDECLMLNLDGFVTEGSGDNLFIIKSGTLYTPPSEAGILEGVTRGFVARELAPALGLKCVEKNLRLDDVLNADEVFLTGTAAEIIGVSQIDQHDGKGNITKATHLSNGEGPITKKLRLKFREIVTGPRVPED